MGEFREMNLVGCIFLVELTEDDVKNLIRAATLYIETAGPSAEYPTVSTALREIKKDLEELI